MLFACLPPEIAAKIISIPIDNFGGNPDKIIWKHTFDGKFTVKSAFSSIGDHYQPGDGIWKCIWSLNIRPKLKIFAWLLVKKRLLTNAHRAHRHLTNDPSCIHCPSESETLLHLFKICPKASTIWNEIGMPVTMARVFRLDWDDWIAANLLQKNCTFLGFPLSQLLIYICWFIWKWRNKSIFDTNFQKPHNAATVIIHYISAWANGNMKPRGNSIMGTEMLRWLKPSPGQFKLNVDGSRTHSGLIGVGGVIRDYDGNWTYSFMRNLGNGEVLKAEAWGLMTGLSIAKELGITHIEVETDSAVLMQLMMHCDIDLHPLGTLLSNCQTMLNSFEFHSIQHIHRERNMVADGLAKRSIDQELGLCKCPSAPSFICQAMLDDIDGFAGPRVFRSVEAF